MQSCVTGPTDEQREVASNMPMVIIIVQYMMVDYMTHRPNGRSYSNSTECVNGWNMCDWD